MTNFYRFAALVATSAILAACNAGAGTSSMPAGTATVNPLDHGSKTTVAASSVFTLTSGAACTTLTVTPVGTAAASILFEEKTDVDTVPPPAIDNDTQFRFQGAFTAAQTFALNPASTLVHIIAFDANGKQIAEQKTAVTSITGCANVVITPLPPGATPVPGASPTPDHDGPGHH